MKYGKRIAALAVSLALAAAAPAGALAAEPVEATGPEEAADPAKAVAPVKTTAPVKEAVPAGESSDNRDLFAAYVNELFYGEAAENGGAEGGAASDNEPVLSASQSRPRRDNLNQQSQAVYDYLKTEIKKIASGERKDTTIQVPLEVLGLSTKTRYTPKQLGLSTVFHGKDISGDAAEKMNAKISVAYYDIVDALLSDLPYQMYWYDKEEGTNFSSAVGLQASGIGSSEWIWFTSGLTFQMTVSVDYAKLFLENGEWYYTRYETDPKVTGAAAGAAEAARQLVDDNKGKTDYAKLHAYKDYICGAVSYNYEAAGDAYRPYGDPWQLIYVFDGDPATNVVCEGYSKAFQYLCDSSDWKDSDFACYSMTGIMSGGTGAGGHMWNLVRLGGSNYLADLTNSDEDSVGENGQLFLTGTPNGNEEGYVFSWDQSTVGRTTYPAGEVSYRYYADTIAQYSCAERSLSQSSYDPGQETCDHNWTEWETRMESTCTASGVEGKTCSICGKDEIRDKEALGHSLKKIPARNASKKAPGEKAHYFCSRCGRLFMDAAGKQETSQADVTIPKLKAQPMTVKAKAKTVSYAGVKKKKKTIKGALVIRNSKGTVTYAKVSASGNSKYLSINKKTGVITVKKGAKKGTHSIKVKVKAAGNASYLAGSKTVTVKIKVK